MTEQELDELDRRSEEPFGRREGDLELRARGMRRAAGGSRRLQVLIGSAIGLGLFLALQVVACQRAAALDEAAYADCREDNLSFAYQRLVASGVPELAQRAPRPAVVLPILWCRRTAQEGRPVRLSPQEETRYLNVFRRECLPLVDGETGRVIGSDSLPGVAQLPPRTRPRRPC